MTRLRLLGVVAGLVLGAGAVAQEAVVQEAAGMQVFAKAAVAADHRLASAAGVEVLRAGGNAVDAAVATSFALSVVRPYSCGIGGGGFMVIRLKEHPRYPEGVTTALNYREWGIGKARPDYFENEPDPDAATHGGKAVCVPGHVAGLLVALEKYGTMTREQVLAPAIRLAEQGYAADAHYVLSSREVIEWIEKDASRAPRFEFLWDRLLYKGKVKEGDKVDLREQARVLRLIAEKGSAGFYEGDVARAIVDAVRRDGGEMTLEDLAGYRVEELKPLVTAFRGNTVLSMPPPSSGGIVLAQVLGMLEVRGRDLERIVKESGWGSAEYVHLVAEAGKHAFADRARWMGDPNFVKVPVKALLSEEYVRGRARAMDLTHVLPIEAYGSASPLPDDGGTSHLCVVDEMGNAVACTETINLVFGSLVAVPEYGFILNDEMDDFLARKGKANAFGLDHADLNRPEAKKRPLSSMTPTIVLKNGEDGKPGDPVLLAGASGGPRIISGTIEASLNVLVFDMPALEAVSRARFHHQWHPDVLELEGEIAGGALEEALKKLGHTTKRRDRIAAVQIIRRVKDGWQPASDPRKGGVPAGY
ncbi:MAG TPA: gamma-glutamyltransferase [Phycisphaerales bacterium]|nr:gamma-glutamyltransferase [Phycisphaerales bacterium]